MQNNPSFPKGYQSEETPIKIYSKAIAYAAKRHKGSYRDGGEDFILHPARVAWRLRRKGESPLVAAAAVLHDTVEEKKTTIEEILKEFGAYVADIVSDLTQREESNADYRERLRIAGRNSRIIKLEDRYDNICDMRKWNGFRIQRYLADTEMLLKALEKTDPDFENLMKEKIASIKMSTPVIKKSDNIQRILKRASGLSSNS